MSQYVPLYALTMGEAVRRGEQKLWQESHIENCQCARAIENTILTAYDFKTSLLEDRARDILEKYGAERVERVLACTLLEKSYDGRFSRENKQWANSIDVPADDVRWQYRVNAHPGLTDLFISQTLRAQQEMSEDVGMTMEGM